MPRTPSQNQAIRDKRRLLFIGVGIKLISTKGLNNIVIDEIAKEVGCSHGLFYHYFKSVEEVYDAILEFVQTSKSTLPLAKLLSSLEEKEGLDGLKDLAKVIEELPMCGELTLHATNIIFTDTKSLKDFGIYSHFERIFLTLKEEGLLKEVSNIDDLIDLLLDTIKGYCLRVMREGKSTKVIPPNLLLSIVLK